MFKKIIILFLFLTNNLFAIEEYFLTLRNEKVNLRQGPSFEYPIKIFYKKKHLPVLVQDKYSNFRKIRDHENNSGWIHVSQLSKKKAAINIDEKTIVFKNPTIYSKPLVILEKGKLCLIIKCKNEWCKIKVGKYKGWVKNENLWGRL
jgi:SH3-like domain-containing protein